MKQQEQRRERALVDACDDLNRCGRKLVELRAEAAAIAIVLADLQACSLYHALADNGHLAAAIVSLDAVADRLTEARKLLMLHESVVIEHDPLKEGT